MTAVERREGGGSIGFASRVDRHGPDSGGDLGEFVAMHRTGRILWRHRQRTPFNSAALTTAGGLVFIGDWNRYANAYDEAPASCCGRGGCPRRCRNSRSALSTAGSTWPSRSVSGPWRGPRFLSG